MFRRGLFPKREVQSLMLVCLAVQFACTAHNIVQITSGQYPVVMARVVLAYVEINGTVADVGESCIQNLLHQSYLLYDMSGCPWFYGRRGHVQPGHRQMVSDSVFLGDFHRFYLLETGFLGYLVLAFVGIVLQMSNVRNIPDIADLVS